MRHFGAHLAITALAGLLAAGCTIQPLYAPPGGTSLSAPAPLASIAIAEVDTRVGQQVRNHLIFLLAGGAGEPASAVYELKLTVRSSSKSALLVQTKTDNEPTAEKVTVTVDYELARISDETEISNRKVRATASYDVSAEEFANVRAERDAENRATQDAAERIRALIAADLKRAGAL